MSTERAPSDALHMVPALQSSGHVLYVSSIDVSLPNGPGVNEREFLLALFDAFGERAHAVLPSPRNSVERPLQGTITWVRPMDRRNPWSLIAHKSEMFSAVASRLESGRIGLVVVRLDILPFEIIRLKRRYDVSYAVKTLGASFATPPGEGGFVNSLKRAAWHGLSHLHRFVTRPVVRGAIAVDACTPELCERAVELMGAEPRKVHLVGNATNVDRFRPSSKWEARGRLGLDAFDPIVGFVGGSPWMRGGMQMIEAAPHLIDEYPDLGVVIVGGGEGMSQLRRRALELGVAERTVMPGVVPYERVPHYVNSFDVGIALEDSERHREFGNSYQKVRQYIACGKPVVSVSGSGIPLEVERLGTIVDPDDPQEVVAAIRAWLDRDSRERDSLQERAVAFAKRELSVESTLAERITIWNNALRRSR